MFIAPLRTRAALLCAALVGLATALPTAAQVALSSGTYTQNFDALGSGLPAGWSVYTGANATALGTLATAGTAAVDWANTSGAFKNFASATGMTGSESATVQATSTNRALGIRQTGAFGDPGAAFAFNFSTTGLQVSSIQFSAQMLSVQTRSTVWSVQYGIGASPTSWTTLTTYTDPGVFGKTPISITNAAFGTALDNQANVWFRVVALAASTGSNSRDSFGIDDVSIVTTAAAVTPPTITTQPTAQTVVVGTPTQLSVVATGTTPLSYQWRKGGFAIADTATITGTTTATLSFSSPQLADAGSYDVVVSNTAGSATSNAVTLTVNPPPTPPSITTQPASTTVNEGTNAQFSVVATGTPTPTYQWRKGTTVLTDGGVFSGTSTDTLVLTHVGLTDAGSYNVVITNSAGSATSNSATLTVNPAPIAPTITTQPSSQGVTVGGNASFTVAASGTPPFAYQWFKNGVALADGGIVSGAGTATLTLTGISGADAGSYTVVVSNSVNPPATSNAANLTVNPVILPTGQIAYAGGNYSQDFNTLPISGNVTTTGLGAGPFALNGAPVNASGLGGWSFAKYAGTGADALFRVDNGTGTSGAVYSYGATNTPDRALGLLASGTTISRFGTALVNNTGQTISSFTLSYTGEEWRRGSAAANTLTLEYAVGATDINTGTFVAAPALNFTAPNTTGVNVSVDGNALGNRTPVSGTVTGITWAPGQTLVLRWTDVNDTGNDDGIAIDDLNFSTPIDAGSVLPAVMYSSPADGAVDVPVAGGISVTFNEPANVSAASFTLNGTTSGAHAVTVSGGPAAYSITPTTPFAEGETVTLTAVAAQITDRATGTKYPTGDYHATFITFSSAPLAIHTIQGSGTASQYAGHAETTQGVVVASFQGAGRIGGYYIETPDAQQDANPATSEGIYVFDNTNSVSVGDLVVVSGTVTEFGTAPFTETEISGVTSFTLVSSGNPLPTPVAVSLPFASAGDQERYEGMLVTFPQTLTVTDNFDLGHFGELILSNGRLSTPTNVVAPGAPAQALEAQNLLNQILLDDGSSTTYPSPTPYLSSADPTMATRRTGSTTTGVTGIIDNRFGTYVLEPTATPTFVEANPRVDSPASAGSLRVAIGNVENFMNGDGNGGHFPTSRGATTFDEWQRQLAKVSAAILNLHPDIMGLTEVENDRVADGQPDSYGPNSAIAQLVASLNANAPAGVAYAFVNAAAVDITTDVIHCALIYRTDLVEEAGIPAMLNDPSFNNLARNPLAQTFRVKATGAKLTVCINHWRAKGGPAPGAGNLDSGDGQGTNNALRVQEADALTSWLATSPTGDTDPDVLIIGDLNSYAKEDPIVHLENAGYISQTERYEGVGGYSYSFNGEFGHLDHALASPSLSAQVLSAATWHVNSDEPTYYDYNVENKDATQQAINAGTPYRYSDHDPVVIGVDLTAPPQIGQNPVSQTVTVGDSVTFSAAAIGFPAPTYQWRKDSNAITDATDATLTLGGVLTSAAGQYDVVVTNSAGTATSAAATLTVNKATPSLTWNSPLAIVYGTALSAAQLNATATVPGTFVYSPAAGSVLNAGANQPLSVTFTPDDAADYTTAAAATTITVTPAPATVTLGNLSQVYDGTPKAAMVSVVPSAVPVQVSYSSGSVPTEVGAYTVTATVTDSNYTGSASSTLEITQATPVITWAPPANIVYGTALSSTQLSATANVPGSFVYTPDVGAVLPAGSHVLGTVFTPTDTHNYTTATASRTLTVTPKSATVTLSNLTQAYDGSPKSATVTTDPTGLTVHVTYNCVAAAPSAPGTYAVIATVDDPNYTGSATGTLFIGATALVRHLPTLDGGVDGSVQVTSTEGVTLNSNAWISGDLLVPGTPSVRLNGHPSFGGTHDGSGAAIPSGYTVTLNGNAVLRYLVRRTDAIALPSVSAPPAPSGTRDVNVNSAGQSVGSFATLRNLTLNGNVGAVAVPPGTYGNFTANGGSSLVFGVVGATTPAAYNLQGLTINGNAKLQIVGPVVINLGNGVSLNGNAGNSTHPEWLTLNVANGSVTLNGNVAFSGSVVAPNGTVTINGNSSLTGTVSADRLVVNGNGVLKQP